MLTPPLLEALLSLFRALLQLGAGYLIGKGYLTADIANALIGVALVVAPMAWGMWQKYQADKKARAAIDAATHAPREVWTEEQRAAMK